MRRYRDTYRIDSTRLPGHDYASAGWYHVVICTQDRACVLGRVRGGIMGLSRAGCVVANAWPETVSRYERAIADAYVVMPNHVHLIVGILPPAPSVETRRGPKVMPVGAARLYPKMMTCLEDLGPCASIRFHLSSTTTKVGRPSVSADPASFPISRGSRAFTTG